MIYRFLVSGLFLLLFLTVQQSYSQTLFMGSESIGIGLQYGYIGIGDVTTSSFTLGFSIDRRADFGFIYTRGTTELPYQREPHTYDMGAIFGTLFPASEWDGDPFTGELMIGAGINEDKRLNGPFLLTGIGFSKSLNNQPDKPGIRPKASLAYTLVAGKRSEDESNQVASSTSVSFELTFQMTGKSGGVLIIPSYVFIPDARTGGLGISASIII